MVAPLKKYFSFTTDYSMKECRKALTSLESEQSSIKLLELDDKRSEILCKLKRHYKDKDKYLAYSEAEIQLKEKEGIVEVSGFAKIFMLQFIFYIYIFGMTLSMAYAFRSVLLISLFWLLGTAASANWLRLIFVNRKYFIQEIYELLDTR